MSVFSQKYPSYRVQEIKRSSKKAIEWIKTAQRADGSWYGSWGIVSFQTCRARVGSIGGSTPRLSMRIRSAVCAC